MIMNFFTLQSNPVLIDMQTQSHIPNPPQCSRLPKPTCLWTRYSPNTTPTTMGPLTSRWEVKTMWKYTEVKLQVFIMFRVPGVHAGHQHRPGLRPSRGEAAVGFQSLWQGFIGWTGNMETAKQLTANVHNCRNNRLQGIEGDCGKSVRERRLLSGGVKCGII